MLARKVKRGGGPGAGPITAMGWDGGVHRAYPGPKMEGMCRACQAQPDPEMAAGWGEGAGPSLK